MSNKRLPPEIMAPVLIAGGGCGGVAAALALLEAGVSAVLVEPTGMLGGQLSSQGVPPDENPWVEGGGPGAPSSFRGCNASYAAFRESVRDWYREHGCLTATAAGDARLNPGGGWVSRLCFEPRIADVVLRRMLADADDGRGLLRIITHAEITAVETERDRIRTVSVCVGGADVVLRPCFVLDATELGDVLCLGDVEHAVGAESSHVYGELHGRADLPAGTDHDQLDQQAFTWCFAVEHLEGEDYSEDQPEGYGRWRSYVPEMEPAWTGRLFDWTVPSHTDSGRARFGMKPWPEKPAPNELELWRYRRVVDSNVHTDARPDVSLFNVVQIDHWAAPLLGTDAEARRASLEAGRTQSACFLHWLRTEAPRADGGCGFPGLRLRGDVLGTNDGFAAAPYIREPRRLLAQRVLTEAHVGHEQRAADGMVSDGDAPMGRGEMFTDSIAIGHYPIDLHPSCSGRNNLYVPAVPYRVPLGAIVPRRVQNLLAAGKCLGVSHIANGCTRLHPVEWAVGEAAAVVAALCVHEGLTPQAVSENAGHIATLQARLAARGVPISWPWEDDR